MLPVFSNRDMKSVNPALYKSVTIQGRYKDKPIDKAKDIFLSVYLIDGKPGSFIFNENFAVILIGRLVGVKQHDGKVRYQQCNQALFYRKLKTRDGYELHCTAFVMPFQNYYDDEPKGQDPKVLAYQSNAIRNYLKVLSRSVPEHHDPRRRNELFDRNAYKKCYDQFIKD